MLAKCFEFSQNWLTRWQNDNWQAMQSWCQRWQQPRVGVHGEGECCTRLEQISSGMCRAATVCLPYQGLFPEMLPFSHPTNLLLMPVHVLSHQDLKQGGREQAWGSRTSACLHTAFKRDGVLPLLWGWCRMCLLLLLLERWHLCPGTSPEGGFTEEQSHHDRWLENVQHVYSNPANGRSSY